MPLLNLYGQPQVLKVLTLSLANILTFYKFLLLLFFLNLFDKIYLFLKSAKQDLAFIQLAVIGLKGHENFT